MQSYHVLKERRAYHPEQSLQDWNFPGAISEVLRSLRANFISAAFRARFANILVCYHYLPIQAKLEQASSELGQKLS